MTRFYLGGKLRYRAKCGSSHVELSFGIIPITTGLALVAMDNYLSGDRGGGGGFNVK